MLPLSARSIAYYTSVALVNTSKWRSQHGSTPSEAGTLFPLTQQASTAVLAPQTLALGGTCLSLLEASETPSQTADEVEIGF